MVRTRPDVTKDKLTKDKSSLTKDKSSRVTKDGKDGLFVRKSMGLEQQNHWALVKSVEAKMKTLRGTDGSLIVFSDASKRQVRQWASIYGFPYKGKAQVSKIAYVFRKLARERDGATRLALCNEFLNEAAVGQIISRHIASKVPHFVKQHAAYIHEGQGNLILDYAGQPFERACIDMNVFEARSIVLQTLVALHIGLKTCHLKHHDMHLENIFVQRLKEDSEFEGTRLTKWS